MVAERVVVKIGSSSLTDATGKISDAKMKNLVEQLARLHTSGVRQLVLVSSGAIAAGIGKLGWTRGRYTLPEKQAASAVGQGLLMSAYERLFEKHSIPVGQILLTRTDIEDRKRFLNIRNTMSTLLHHGILPIVNENDTVAVDEIRFGDNDTLASLVALTVGADWLLLLTDIDGLYTSNPQRDAGAKRISEVWEITEEMERMAGQPTSSVGTGGMRTKLTAAKIATQAGANVLIAASHTDDVLCRALTGEPVGTLFHAAPKSLAARKSWLAFGARSAGKIFVDPGASKAIGHRSSLLLPGVTAVEGDFVEGDTVDLCEAEGRVLGRGITNFSSRDLSLLLDRRREWQDSNRDGVQSEAASGTRGTDVDWLKGLEEVVHRNDLSLYR
jgi:glutamate 5-kinase